MNRFIVMTRSAGMPSGTWGRYRRVAVVETSLETGEPRMISIRSRGVVRIMQTWDRVNANGKNTAYVHALAEAEALAARLNGRKRRKAA